MFAFHFPVREALEDFFKRVSSLDPRQRRAHAGVEAIAERQMRACLTLDIETVAIDNTAMIAIGGADQKIDRTAFGNLDALYLDIAGDVARGVRAGRFEAQNFFDPGRDPAGILGTLAPLFGMFGAHSTEAHTSDIQSLMRIS